ncbi:MAG: FAD:protein FMN transferase [Phycisphaerae bacterium]|nr:FAD:protein FMN transferase [Tepidisphaeraceae bacterium]
MTLHSSRRRVLTAAIGGVAAWGLWRARPTSEASPAGIPPVNGGPPPIVRTTRALGTDVSVTIAGADVALVDRTVAAAFAELHEVESVLSVYDANSQVSRLNRDGSLDGAHPHLLAVLAEALSTARRSAGAFDVTVQPLWLLHAEAARAGRRPTDDEIAAGRRLVDYRRVTVAGRTVRFETPGMAVTFNGIAQGYATDRVSAVLRAHGIAHALVDVGELSPIGAKPDGQPWTAGVQHPREADAFVDVARLDGRCLATSGDYASTFGAGQRDHHIFDPGTGRSPTVLASVSVVARTAMAADALSTAVFVLGPDRGRRLVESTSGADALFVLKDGSTARTAGFPSAAV